MRGVLARIAVVASQIAACHERYGPDQPWGFADPTSWKCSPRYCAHWASPGRRGLQRRVRPLAPHAGVTQIALAQLAPRA